MPKTYRTFKTILERIDQMPPWACRLIARTGGLGRSAKALTIYEIAERGGLTWQKAAWVSRQPSWAKVTVEIADKFRKGCGINMANERQQRCYLIRTKTKSQKGLNHLDRLPEEWDSGHRRRFKKRIARMIDRATKLL